MKVRTVIRLLEEHGFHFVRQRGSHRRFVGEVDGQTHYVTVAGKEGDDISQPTLHAIRRQSGLPADVFR